MFEEIQEVVRRNLPSEVGETLRKYLKDAVDWKERLDRYCKDLEVEQGKVKTLRLEVTALEAELRRAGDLAKREKAVHDLESNLRVQMAEFAQKCAEAKTAAIMELAAMAFRNPKFVTSEQNQVPYWDQQGHYQSTMCGSRKVEKTQE